MARPARAALAVAAAVAAAAVAYALLQPAPPDYSGTLYADAEWNPATGNVTVTYTDRSMATERVTLEVLGLATTLQKNHTSSHFVEQVEFGSVPANGWRAHPVTFAVTHGELGEVGIKVEVHGPGEPARHTVYSGPR